MSKTIREHISNIQVEKSNLQHIAETGKINGSLLISIEKAIRDYSQSQTQELKEQNRELIYMYKECFEMFIPSEKWDEATEFLSTYGSGLAKDLCKKEKHNHLKSNTNG